jgi:hypothetical protein
LAQSRPKSKELSAFPKSYPLRNRAIGGEITVVLKNPPRELAETLAQVNSPCDEIQDARRAVSN